ncbi:MAG: hypothetical protein KDA20_01500 [Phycisphaerales bacterium]|nr:hypothetical protein [Phycisphaerales bacterium]
MASLSVPCFLLFAVLLCVRKRIAWVEGAMWSSAFIVFALGFYVWLDGWEKPSTLRRINESEATLGTRLAKSYKTLADYFDLETPLTIRYTSQEGFAGYEPVEIDAGEIVELVLTPGEVNHKQFAALMGECRLRIRSVSDVDYKYQLSDGAGFMYARSRVEPGVAFIEQVIDGQSRVAQVFDWDPDRVLVYLDKHIEVLFNCSTPTYDLLQHAQEPAPSSVAPAP